MRETDRPAFTVTEQEVVIRLDGRRLRFESGDDLTRVLVATLHRAFEVAASDVERSGARLDVGGDSAFSSALSYVALALRAAANDLAQSTDLSIIPSGK